MNNNKPCPEAQRRDCTTLLHITDTLAHVLVLARSVMAEHGDDAFERTISNIDAALGAHAGLRMTDRELDERISELDDWYQAHPETYGVEAEYPAWLESSRLEDIQGAREIHARGPDEPGFSRYQIPAFFCISAGAQEDAEFAAANLAIELNKLSGPNPTLRLCEQSKTTLIAVADESGLIPMSDPHCLASISQSALS